MRLPMYLLAGASPARRWQVAGQPALDWQSFLAKKNAELQRLNGVYMNLLKNSGVDVSGCLQQRSLRGRVSTAPCCSGSEACG